MDGAWGSGPPFGVGIEDELFVVDAATRRLAPLAVEVLAALGLPAARAGHEAYAAEIELRSTPAASAAVALDELRALRRRALAAAERSGGTLIAAGLHPDAGSSDTRLVDSNRYRTVWASMRGLIQRTPECALHVHVGMPDAETAIRAFNGLRRWLPLLRGLAASSPYWFGRDSGLASARDAQVRAYPGRGVPRPLRDAADWQRAVADATAGGGPDDYTLLWWDVRLHPRLGTVEVRELDAQPRIEDAVAIAALAQALARHEAERPAKPEPSETIAWSAFRAMRDGLQAEIHWDGRLAPLPEVARAALARAATPARELGSEDVLGGVERILREGGGADRQRAAHGRGGIPAVLDLLATETRGDGG